MPTTVTAVTFIRTAPGTIYTLWRDLDQWHTWQPETVSAQWLAGAAPWSPDSRFDLLRRSPYKITPHRRFVGYVRSAAQDQMLVWELLPTSAAWFGPTLVESVRLDPAPGGTNITITITAHGFGPTILAPILKPSLRGQVDALLDALKHKLRPIERRL